MKKITLSLLHIFLIAFVFAQTVADFENLSLPADTFWNGSDGTGGFSSGNAFFPNNYDTTFVAWTGFTYSTMTDTLTPGIMNQYSAIAGGGANGSATYAVADEYGNAKVILSGNAVGKTIKGTYVTNNTYSYLSMRNGDSFSKKFGGTTGADEDWLKLTVKGWLGGNLKSNEVEFYLADYRFADSTQDYLVKNWAWLNLQPLGDVDSIQFFLSSSDTGQFGMNTPAYFCLDNFTTNDHLVNAAPVSSNDEYYITYLQDTALNVLDNDFDTTLTPLHVSISSGPIVTGATAVVDSFNRIYYTPAIGIVTTDTLTYSLCDDAGLCASAQVVIHVSGINSVQEFASSERKVYPNPFSDVVQIQLAEGIHTLQLMDISGRVLRQLHVRNESTATLHTAALPSGIYLLRMLADGNNFTKKIVKE